MNIKMRTHNIQTEKKVLHLLLNQEDAIDMAISANLSSEDFSAPRYSMFFEKIIDIYLEQRIAVGDDLDIIINRLDYDDDKDKKESVLSITGIQKLLLANKKKIQIKFLSAYLEEMKKLSKIRTIVRGVQSITKCLNSEESTYDDLSDTVEAFNDTVMNSDVDITRMDMDTAVKETVKEVVEEAEYDNNVKFYLEELDTMAKILKGYLTYIAAAPGIGKSTVLLNMVNNMSDNKVKVGYFSLEMNISDCVKRLISMREGIYSQRLTNPSLLRSKDWTIIEDILDNEEGLRSNNIYWVGKPDLTIPELHNEISRLVKAYDIDVVVIDYYQLLKLDSDSNLPESIEIPRVSTALRVLASKEYMNPYGKMKKIYMVALSQIVKEVEKREDKHPFMNDMFYGGAKDARLVVGLYRDEYYYPDTTTKPNVIEYGIIKQNNGIMNEWVDAYYDTNSFYIRDLTDEEKSIIVEKEENDDYDEEDYEESDD